MTPELQNWPIFDLWHGWDVDFQGQTTMSSQRSAVQFYRAQHAVLIAILTECHSPQQTQVQGFSKHYFSRIILFLSIFSIPIPIAIPIPICRGLVIGVGIGIGIAIGIDFLFLNTVQLELLLY